MASRLIIDGNTVYEIDEECLRRKQGKTADQYKSGRRCGGNHSRKMDAEEKTEE